MRRGRILFAAFDYPPDSYPGTRRSRKLVKYLVREGYEVVLLTSRAGSPVHDPSGGEELIRTRDLLTTPLNWRRGNIDAQRGRGGDYSTRRSLPAKLLVPDPMLVSWLPFAIPRALADHRRRPFDCVLTSSPPESTHLIGVALARRGVPWLGELRDGWSFERPRRQFPTRLQRRLDAWLERRVLRRADRITTVSGSVAVDLRERIGVDPATIGHGYDFEAYPERGPGDLDGLDPNRHSIVHTGTMAYYGRTLAPLLEALELLRRRDRDAFERLELLFAGALTPEERDQLHSPWLSGTARALGVVDHAEAIRLQRRADTLLLLTVPGMRGEVAGKLGEYLVSGRPIVVVGDRAESARIVDELGAGTAVPEDDPERIAAALAAAVAAGRRPSRSGPARDRVHATLDFGRVAARMAEQIEAVRRAGSSA